MARPRVIIASPDANVAVKLIASLNPKRYRVEHIHDLDEALLRAELVLAHSAVVHVADATADIKKRFLQSIDRGLTLVLVSPSATVADAAAEIGARYLSVPFAVQDVKRVVYRAVSDAHALRSDDQLSGARSVAMQSANTERRVVLLVRDLDAAQIMAAVFRSQLAVGCPTATKAVEVIAQLADGVDCLVADAELLVTSEEGASLARKLARRGVPVVPLGMSEELDSSSAGQLAWSIVPQVRRILAARDKPARAAG
jgi:ActR/RegA family two-component response regulator